MADSSLRSHLIVISALLAASLIISLPPVVSAATDNQYDLGTWMIPSKQSCTGTIADCMAAGGGEFEMDSESNRRILATSGHISYGALQPGNVPCSQRGASYYNCKSGAQANPYQRGCSAITRCRS